MAAPSAMRLRHVGTVAAAAALFVGAGGCGGVKRGENPNLVAGKQAFVGKGQCGSCHTLSRAGTKGTAGPNLDDAFRDSLASGLRRETVRGVVHGQILFPNPKGVMPRNLVSGRTCGGGISASACVNDIAAYVAQSVDRSGQDTGLLASAVQAPGSGKPAVETGGKLQIDADPTGQLSYVTKQAQGKPGPVTITMKNGATVQHNIAVQQGTGPSGPVLGAGPVVANGGTSTVKLTLKPGTYTYFCQVPGHRAAGMFGTLTVK
jgi:plastocyanin